ncbi:hypothetical protein AY586_15220 [Marichromatium gracile]|uniref:Uncharacterized protein n=1 Tax=Marichromatium gracile TaxID=1048 RepID=A0ABR5VE82_MARGR|nr:hypothetical protein AY586_15220 [Marichromatium gracile]
MAVGVMMLAPVSLVLEGGVRQTPPVVVYPDLDPVVLARAAAARPACQPGLLAGILTCSNRWADTERTGVITTFSMYFEAMGHVPTLDACLIGMDSTRRKSRMVWIRCVMCAVEGAAA